MEFRTGDSRHQSVHAAVGAGRSAGRHRGRGHGTVQKARRAQDGGVVSGAGRHRRMPGTHGCAQSSGSSCGCNKSSGDSARGKKMPRSPQRRRAENVAGKARRISSARCRERPGRLEELGSRFSGACRAERRKRPERRLARQGGTRGRTCRRREKEGRRGRAAPKERSDSAFLA